MRVFITLLFSTVFVACSPSNTHNDAVESLAKKLSEEGGQSMLPINREIYVACGVSALSNLPTDRIKSALKETDGPSRWAILGTDALNDYVRECRKVDPDRIPKMKP